MLESKTNLGASILTFSVFGPDDPDVDSKDFFPFLFLNFKEAAGSSEEELIDDEELEEPKINRFGQSEKK